MFPSDSTAARRPPGAALFAFLVGALFACESIPTAGPEAVTSVTVSPQSAELDALDATVQLEAAAAGESGDPVTDVSFTWESETSTVATVDDAGLVTAVANGAAAIVASTDRGTASGTANITVSQRSAVVDVRVSPSQIAVGDTAVAEVEVLDRNAHPIADAIVVLSVADTTVATSDTSGHVIARSAGETVVRATSGTATGEADLTVVRLPVAAVELIPSLDSIPQHETTVLTAVTCDSSGQELAGRFVAWRSSDTTVAIVDSLGGVTGIRPGRTQVYANSEGVEASAEVVVVLGEVAEVRLSPDSASIYPPNGSDQPDTLTATASVLDSAGRTLSGWPIRWESTHPEVALVDTTGHVQAAAAGTAGILALAGDSASVMEVTVEPIPVADVVIGLSDVVVYVDSTRALAVAVLDSRGVALSGWVVQWASQDTAIAVVGADGRVEGRSTGSTSLVATSEGVSDTADVTVSYAPGAHAVSVGRTAACAVVAGDRVTCWGENAWGQLGMPPSSPYGISTPVVVPLPTGEYVDVGVGEWHVCAVSGTGYVYCWGEAGSGQMGNGTTSTISEPVVANRPVGASFVSVTAGQRFNCALTTEGAAYCWGDGGYGQLGNGGNMRQTEPTPVQQPEGVAFTDIAAGRWHVCALDANGGVYCWGKNDYGQVGDGSDLTDGMTDNRYVPTKVALPAASSAIAAGDWHSCAATEAATYCWGTNGNLQLGQSTDYFRHSTPLESAPAMAGLGLGGRSSCGVKADGGVVCWGSNDSGQFGNGDPTYVMSQAIPALGGRTLVSLDGGGATYSGGTYCGIKGDGSVVCWASRGWGMLGDGSIQGALDPAAPPLPGVVVSMDRADAQRACALTDDSRLFCWQNLEYLAADIGEALLPVEIPTPDGATLVSITLGTSHLCALDMTGTVFCRGANHAGQLGNGGFNYSSEPSWTQALWPDSTVRYEQVDAAGSGTCALASDASIYCWGSGYHGELGNGTAGNNSGTPVRVAAPEGTRFATVARGDGHACGVTEEAGLYCWGWNYVGQLGDGTTTDASAPVVVATELNAIHVSTGRTHTCAVLSTAASDSSGTAYCWGERIGSVPTAVSGEPVLSSIYAGSEWSCGIEPMGTSVCWGRMPFGQAGNGSFGTLYSPAAAYGGRALQAIAGGRETSCALDRTGTVWCAGWHRRGNTGVGMRSFVPEPVRVWLP